MGQGKPKSDPYFTPPEGGNGNGNGPGRGRPFLEPPAFRPGGDQQQPPAQQTQEPPRQQTSPDLRPPDQQWKPPANGPTWSSPQPFGGDKTQTPLGQATGSNARRMVDAREHQYGSSTAKAIIAGTSAAVFAEPMVKGMGILAEKGVAAEGTGLGARSARTLGGLWHSQIDPIGRHSSQIIKEESMVAKSFESITKTHQLDKQLLDKLRTAGALVPEERAHLLALKEGLKITDDAKLVEALMERQSLYNPSSLKALNAAETLDHLNKVRALEMSGGNKILTVAERAALETRQLALTNIGKLETAAAGAKIESRWISGSGAWDNAKRAFGLTLGTGMAIEGDHYVRERMYGKDAKSWETTSATVPLAMALGSGFKWKAGLTAVAVAGGHLVDQGIEAPSWIPESLKHFSAFDAVPLGIAFAIPTKGKIAKTAVIGTAAILGNVAESTFTGPSAGDIEKQAQDTAMKDNTERTFDSMERGVKGFKELGGKNEIVLEQNLANILVESNTNYAQKSPEEKLAAHRKTAMIARAIGEHRLEHGTRLSAAATDRPTYVLDGMNLDMGGDALTFLQMSRNSINGSKQMTELMISRKEQAFGSAVSQEEIADLNKAGDKVQASINAINGKHDIEGAMTKLKAFIERGTTSNGATLNKELAFHKTFVEDINRKLGRNMPALRSANGELNPDAAMIVSKLLRDQALAKLTHAAYKLDHGNDPIGAGQMIFGTPQGRNEWLPGSQNPKGFDGALEAIMLAERLSPNNPDLPELKAIAKRLADEVKAKAPEQYGNYKSNPLGVRQ